MRREYDDPFETHPTAWSDRPVFFEPTETPYDLRWRMLGTDIRVNPWFWLMTVVLGWSLTRLGFQFLLVWVLCVFVSILVHEFGHVLMGRAFGTDGHIILYSFGGLAVGSSALNGRWRRIAVYFAGPAAGFLLLTLVLICVWKGVYFSWDEFEHDPLPHFRGLENLSKLANSAIRYLIWINLAWGLINLLPIWPLDGGRISYDFLGWLSPDNGGKAAFVISMIIAGLLALHALAREPIVPILPSGDWYAAILFGSLALGSYQALQAERRRNPWEQ
jgi:Zn-dependent protease